MNGEAPPQPIEHLARRLLNDMETMARREPAKAVMSAVGVGIALNALPTRAIVSGVTAVTVILLRPVLLTLGVVKLLELARSQTLRIP